MFRVRPVETRVELLRQGIRLSGPSRASFEDLDGSL
jgi:hypothetical protein